MKRIGLAGFFLQKVLLTGITRRKMKNGKFFNRGPGGQRACLASGETTVTLDGHYGESDTLVEGMKPREIAPRVGLSPELVRTRKSRAVRVLVERVEALSRT